MKPKREYNRIIPAVFGILRRGPEVLIARRANTGYRDGFYSLPAGHVEAGEYPTGALIRELKEELGISVDAKDVHFAHAIYRAKSDETSDRLNMFFIVDNWVGEINNAEPGKCDEVCWCRPENFPPNVIPYVREVVEALGKSFYSEGQND